MTKTTIQGLKASHRIVTQGCRSGKGGDVACAEALASLKEAFERYADQDGSEAVDWHFVLVREDL